MNRLEKLPVPILPTFVGAATLANVYSGLSYTWIRHLTMLAAAVVLICYLLKILLYPKTFLAEYSNVVPASLYAGFSMVTMILGSYIFEFQPVMGKGIWFLGVGIHFVHLIIFTVRNVIIKRDINTFVPSWFVTYNGIMVASVVGGPMNQPGLLKIIVYYGIVIYAVLLPIMLWRLLTKEVKEGVYHTMAVLLAPCSLCVVGYLNITKNPNGILIVVLYICVLLSLLFVVVKLPKFFSFSFSPAYAGMTFPMAIGIVASNKMAGYLTGSGYDVLGKAVTQLAGIQIYLTTMIVGAVLVNFLIMFLKIQRK